VLKPSTCARPPGCNNSTAEAFRLSAIGDVLTGVVTGLIGQRMVPLEPAILGVYLHGLAGDFAADELGRRSMTAMDLIEYLPEAFSEHELTGSD